MELRELDEDLLHRVLAAAVRDADPEEVMAPVPGPPGWTASRQQAFLRFHRARCLSDRPSERTFAVLHDGAVVGAARLEPLPQPPDPPPDTPAVLARPTSPSADGTAGPPADGSAGPPPDGTTGHRTVEAGVWLGRSVRGLGLGHDVLAALLRAARADGAHCLLARTTPDNAAALAVLTALGARLTHEAPASVTARFPLTPHTEHPPH